VWYERLNLWNQECTLIPFLFDKYVPIQRFESSGTLKFVVSINNPKIKIERLYEDNLTMIDSLKCNITGSGNKFDTQKIIRAGFCCV
jgi:spore maturation protein SpmB